MKLSAQIPLGKFTIKTLALAFLFGSVLIPDSRAGEFHLNWSSEGVELSEGAQKVFFYQRAPKSLDGKYPRANYLHPDTKPGGRTLADLIIPGLILALPMGLVLLQPDLGTAMVLAFIFASVMMLTQLKMRSVVTLLATFVVAAPVTWFYLLKDYQKERITAFWDRIGGTQADLLDSGWHTHQSLVAIGSGGLTGKGFTQGTQTRFRFLPDQHTDFPFPVWAEEHGFLGAVLLISLYLFLVLWALRIASPAKDRFGAVLAVGVGAMIFWQTVVNLGMVSGLLPVVGMTLPLFSYGGSSLLSTMLGLGLLMNVSMRRFSH